MKASELLREARNVLFERGWCQNALEDEGRVCAVGAVNVADHGCAQWDFENYGASISARAALNAAAGTEIVAFNNTPERTFDEIVDVFDKAEKIALIAEESDA
jgi:hypothetical protein